MRVPILSTPKPVILLHGKGCIRPVSLQRWCVIGPMSLNFHSALLCILQFSFAKLFRNYVIILENNSCLNVYINRSTFYIKMSTLSNTSLEDPISSFSSNLQDPIIPSRPSFQIALSMDQITHLSLVCQRHFAFHRFLHHCKYFALIL